MNYAWMLRDALEMESLSYSNNLVCANPFRSASTRWKETKAKFEEQMARYKFVYNQLANAFTMPKATVSGKGTSGNGKNGNFQDDLMFTTTMCNWLCTQLKHQRLPNFPYHMIQL